MMWPAESDGWHADWDDWSVEHAAIHEAVRAMGSPCRTLGHFDDGSSCCEYCGQAA